MEVRDKMPWGGGQNWILIHTHTHTHEINNKRKKGRENAIVYTGLCQLKVRASWGCGTSAIRNRGFPQSFEGTP